MGVEDNGNKLHVLVVEEDDATRSACVEIANQRGFAADGLPEADDAQQLLLSHTVDLLLLELKASRQEDLQLLSEVKALKPETAIIVMTAAPSIPSAVEAVRRGATAYIAKPFTVEQLEAALRQAAQQRGTKDACNLVGQSPEMDKLYRMLTKVAQSHHSALIVGESGTGKETMARTIHAQSAFSSEPFLTVDCGALAPELIERELFGYVKGAFPSAVGNMPGLLATAGRGTVLLKEVAQLTPELQSKLLRALHEKEVRPAGAAHRIPFHARILAASSVDLAAAVTKGTFRKDLYYRLNVVTLRIPPLRERRSDIPLLARHFMERISLENGQNYRLSDDTLHSMLHYDWPNNIRELENVIERGCAMSVGPVIYIADLPTQIQNHELGLRREAHTQRIQTQVRPDHAVASVISLADIEKQAIVGAIRRLKGDKLLAASLLGIGKTTLYRKLKEYGLSENVPLELLER